jgi:ATP-dependent exoDNAse (exonuclease V) beta subunit
VGGAVHRALEGWDLDADPDEELERHMAVMHMYVPSALDPSHRSQVVREACEMLRRFRDGPLLKRLISIRGEILARELPVVLPVTGDSPDGPIQFLEGSVDLVYRDPQRGRMIVVDYKTDRIETPEEIKRRAAAYALQGRIYARALKEGLALNEDPAFEIWFIYPGITSYMEPLAHS